MRFLESQRARIKEGFRREVLFSPEVVFQISNQSTSKTLSEYLEMQSVTLERQPRFSGYGARDQSG
jgi:hypothetical protein